jgi:hypothetical protein
MAPAAALALLSAVACHSARGEVEYLHYDNFSVISEPSGIIDEASGGTRTENVFILRDTIAEDDLDAGKDCVFFDGNTSITWQTPDATPVLYVYERCGSRMEIRFRDLEGRSWRRSELVPLRDGTFAKALARLPAAGGTHRIRDDHTRLAEYAVCKGVVPRPPWFKGGCGRFPD